MAKNLNLDQLSDAMRKQQEGKSGKKIVWDRENMSFVELGPTEREREDQSVVNDVSKRPFYQ